MSFDAYTVAVKIKIINEVSPVLMAISGHFRKLDEQTKAAGRGLDDYASKLRKLHRDLASAKNLGLAGGLMFGAGAGMLGLMKGPLDEARKFQTEVAKFSALGLGDGVTSQAVKFANSMNVMGQSARDNMKLLREAQAITGDFDHAKEMTPILARMKFGIESVMSKDGRGAGHGEQSERMFMDLIKTAELRGALKDMDKFKAVANLAAQAYVASGGTVKPGDFLQMIKTGGTAAKTMNDQAFWFSSLHTMGEMGGSRTGTALMSAYQNLVMGRTTQQVAEQLAQAGLIDKSKVAYGKSGHLKMLPGALADAEAYKANPFHYMHEKIEPLLRARGMDDAQIQNELQKYASNRTALSLLDTMFRERANIARSEAQAAKAMGIDDLYQLGSGTFDGKELELRAKWADAQREFGNNILPLATKALDAMTGALKSFTQYARENPGTIKALTGAFVGLGGALLFGGTVAGVTAAFKGLNGALTAISLLSTSGGLAAAASGIGALAMSIGRLGLIGGAAYGGWKVGGWISDKIEGTKASDFIGSTVAHLMAPFSDEAAQAIRANSGKEWYQFGPKISAYQSESKRSIGLPPGSSSERPIHVTVTMPNGEVLARVVTKEQGKMMSRQPTGPRAVDPTAALFPVSASLGY